MPDLVPVHGGLEAPVSRTVPLSRRKQFLAEAAALPRIEMSRADLATVYRIADGTLSPLDGPMDEETWHYVLDNDALDFGFRRYAWTAPIAFPVTDDEAKQLRVGHARRSSSRATSSACCASRASSTGTRPSTSSASTAPRAPTIRAGT